jgi:hypothetical protein
MKPFNLRFDILLIRFYLMMAVIIASIFIGLPYLAFLGLPIFLSAMMGISFKDLKQASL